MNILDYEDHSHGTSKHSYMKFSQTTPKNKKQGFACLCQHRPSQTILDESASYLDPMLHIFTQNAHNSNHSPHLASQYTIPKRILLTPQPSLSHSTSQQRSF